MVGDFSGALPKLKDQLDNTRVDDQPLLFVAIQVLFKMHQQDKSLSPDNLAAVPRPTSSATRSSVDPIARSSRPGGDRCSDANRRV